MHVIDAIREYLATPVLGSPPVAWCMTLPAGVRVGTPFIMSPSPIVLPTNHI